MQKQSIPNFQQALGSLQECFLNFSPKESKDLLLRMFSAMLLQNFSELPKHEKANLFSFYIHLQNILDVSGELSAEEQDQTSQSRIFKNIPKNPE